MCVEQAAPANEPREPRGYEGEYRYRNLLQQKPKIEVVWRMMVVVEAALKYITTELQRNRQSFLELGRLR